MDEDAVSPVIGVILMVAIVVVLAAVIFVLVSSTSGDNIEKSATMVGQRDEANDKWVIVTGADVPQDRFSFHASEVGLRYAWNETATSGSAPLTTSSIEMGGDEPWGAGSYLSVCSDGLPKSGVTVTFVDDTRNTVVTETTFGLVASCL